MRSEISAHHTTVPNGERSPFPLPAAAETGSTALTIDVRQVADLQRWLIVAVVAQCVAICCWPLLLVVLAPMQMALQICLCPALRWRTSAVVMSGLTALLPWFGAVSELIATVAATETVVLVISALTVLLSLVALVSLLITNVAATQFLQSQGISVGLLGAKRSQLPPPGTRVEVSARTLAAR